MVNQACSIDLCTNRIVVNEFLLVINWVIVCCIISEIWWATDRI